ncbi:MOSC domain-containing protein [bacterium]|nr:MOSC domain-containing protein [bacterium]NIN92075.1 MOSC domain-containing protein [bacterium]NIO18288.1 MOSC domain-containing protein [bacterium]NIO73262.1 MOSC domain-containing protein [bacterium]
MGKIRIISINRSDKKGTVKKPMRQAILRRNWGLVGDAHGGLSRRQVSLLGIENIRKFMVRIAKLKRCKSAKFKIGPGDFAENITTGGFDLNSLPMGTKLKLGNRAVIEITQRGKACHTKCEIRKLVGNCIMPKEGLFARVISGGKIKVGDPIEIERESL